MSVSDASPSGDSLVDITCGELRRLIVDGGLSLGSRIVETEMAARLSVSRRTIQSVLRTLQREGLILRPGGQRTPWFVAPLTIRGLREICDLMGALECWIVRRAAELAEGPRGRLADELRLINHEFRGVITGPEANLERAAELDGRFHGCFVDRVGGETLKRLHEAHRPKATLYIRNYMENQAPIGLASADEHDALIDAIADGDPDTAERALRTSWLDAFEWYAEIIKNVGERGVW